MKRIVCAAIAAVLSLTCLTACGDNTLTEEQVRRIVQEEWQKNATRATEDAFVVGETVPCVFGESFERPVYFPGDVASTNKYHKKVVTITEFSVKAKKIADPNDPDDYVFSNYTKYIYTITARGHIAPSLKDKAFYIHCDSNVYPLLYDDDGSSDMPEVKSDGSFDYTATVGSYDVLHYVVPNFTFYNEP